MSYSQTTENKNKAEITSHYWFIFPFHRKDYQMLKLKGTLRSPCVNPLLYRLKKSSPNRWLHGLSSHIAGNWHG